VRGCQHDLLRIAEYQLRGKPQYAIARALQLTVRASGRALLRWSETQSGRSALASAAGKGESEGGKEG
jgi:hypothetical protein